MLENLPNNLPSKKLSENLLGKTQKRLVVVGLIVLVLVVVASVLYYKIFSTRPEPVTQQPNLQKVESNTPISQSPAQELKKVEVSKDKLPYKMPDNLPLVGGSPSTVYENYEINRGENDFQSTRSFTSSQTFPEIKKQYSEYFKDFGWKTVSSIEDGGFWMLAGEKDDLFIQINVNQDLGSKNYRINISLTQKPG